MSKKTGAWWWVDRWRKSTAYTDMTAESQGVYRNLLDELTLRNGVIPNDERILAKIGGDPEAWPRVRQIVLARFYETPEGLRNTTHDEVSGGSAKQSEQQSEKGKARAANAPREGGRFTSRQPAEPPAVTPAVDQPQNQPSVSVSVSVNRLSETETDPGRSVKTVSPNPGQGPNGTPVKLSDVFEPTATASKITPQSLGIKTDPGNFAQIQLSHDLAALTALELRTNPGTDVRRAALGLLRDISTTRGDGKAIQSLDWTSTRGGYISPGWAKISSDAAHRLALEVYGTDLASEAGSPGNETQTNPAAPAA